MAATSPTLSIVDRDVPYVNPVELFRAFSATNFCQLLHSGRSAAGGGRYSLLYSDPFDVISTEEPTIESRQDGRAESPFDAIRRAIQTHRCTPAIDPSADGLIAPFGLVGFLGYELLHQLEPTVGPPNNPSHLPALAMAAYDTVICFDHTERRAKIFSCGLPELNEPKRMVRAQKRADSLQQRFFESLPNALTTLGKDYSLGLDPMGGTQSVLSQSVSKRDYCEKVERARRYIHAGDIFQVNISHEFVLDGAQDLYTLFELLCDASPVSYAAFCRFPQISVASNSPERFLRVTRSKDTFRVSTKPIKGTARRSGCDEAVVDELRNSPKDRAENIMIVDLMRNDLSKVCTDDSVEVKSLCEPETYKTLHHLVSEVTGILKDEMDCIDVLEACFPGGSITGAPKVRAMQIISELEQRPRGPYCGSIGYIGFDGTMDLNIAIRTLYSPASTDKPGIFYPVGCGIVADSIPEKEWEESLTKALNLTRALELTGHRSAS